MSDAPNPTVPAEAAAPQKEIEKFLAAALKMNASDIHVKVGEPVLFRVKGTVQRTKTAPLSAAQVNKFADELMGERERDELDRLGGCDFAYAVRGAGRFRVNIFKQRGSISIAARAVKVEVPTVESLNLPPAIKGIIKYENGLVLVGGITGAGKSTTLAALIQIINETEPVHIVTLENPIEYLYHDDKAIINQREIGIDVPDYANGLRHVLRQDPDVILIGEMRDADTFESALQASETGHLVFGTVHTLSAAQTISRVLDYFPPDRHFQIRQALYFSLRAVVVQKLMRGITAEMPRVPACEIMFVTPMIKKLIFESEDKKIPDVIRASRQEGMQDFNQSLHDLVKRGVITEQTALDHSPNPDQLAMNLKGINFSAGLVG
jgi:twitching motility protein PilT